jgi:flagellar protein FliS
MSQYAINQYKKVGVQTADQGKLLLLLYDGAIKKLNEAINGVKEKNIEKSHNNIIKTQKIINELLVSLNIEDGGEIAKNLQGIYVFINKQLMVANLKKDEKILLDILEMVSNIRDAFKQIINTKKNISSNDKINPESQGINIKV